MKYLFAAVYVLVLITQLPHVWFAYANLEAPSIPVAQWTAIGAALAFELSTGVFTFRIIRGSRRRWTRLGLAFFIVASVVANGYYYGWARSVFDTIWPAFATLALPLALALFAHEFGTVVKREHLAALRAKRAETTQQTTAPVDESHPCALCDFVGTSQQALAGHMKRHSNHRERKERITHDLPVP